MIRLFPNTHGLGPARFQNLRAAGAFLIGAAHDADTVGPVTLLSEKGAEARIANPWVKAAPRVTRLDDGRLIECRLEDNIVRFATEPDRRYRLDPA